MSAQRQVVLAAVCEDCDWIYLPRDPGVGKSAVVARLAAHRYKTGHPDAHVLVRWQRNDERA